MGVLSIGTGFSLSCYPIIHMYNICIIYIKIIYILKKNIFPLLPALSARSRSTRMYALGPSEWESDLEYCLEQATVAHIPTSTHTHTYSHRQNFGNEKRFARRS